MLGLSSRMEGETEDRTGRFYGCTVATVHTSSFFLSHNVSLLVALVIYDSMTRERAQSLSSAALSMAESRLRPLTTAGRMAAVCERSDDGEASTCRFSAGSEASETPSRGFCVASTPPAARAPSPSAEDELAADDNARALSASLHSAALESRDEIAGVLQHRRLEEEHEAHSGLAGSMGGGMGICVHWLSLIHISEPRDQRGSRMPSSA